MRFKKYAAVMLAFVMLFGLVEPFAAYTRGKPVRVGVFDLENFHKVDEEGDVTGFCVDYLYVIADVTGWTYEFVEVNDFMEGMELLEQKELDLIAPAMQTDERKETFLYSELCFGMEYSVLLTTSDREDLFYQDYKGYDGLKVAVLNGYPMTDYFVTKMQSYGVSQELVYYDTIEECKAALERGEADALVTSILYYDESYKLLDSFYPQPFYFMTHKENLGLIGELNRAMDCIQDTYPTLLDELLYTYYPIYEEQFFTKEEIEYVKAGRELRVAYVSDRKPLSFTNEKGELDGISRELFDLISQLSGLQFTYVALPEGNITYEYLQEQKIDLITGVEYNSANMNSRGVYLSRPYSSGRKVMVSQPKFVYSPDENYKLAIVEGSKTFNEVIEEKYPNMEIIEFKTVEDCFHALYKKEVDLLLQNRYVVETMMGKPIYSSFSVVPLEGLEDQLCFSTIVPLDGGYGLDKEESSIIVSILNKCISRISEVEMDTIMMREIVENQYEVGLGDLLYNYRVLIIVLSAAFLIVSVLLFVYRREKIRARITEEKERHLKEIEQRRYHKLIECSDDMIYEISIDGEASMGSEKIKEKFGWEIPKGRQKLTPKRAMQILHIYKEDEPIFFQSQLLNGEAAFDNMTLRLCKADGTPVWCHVSRTILTDKKNHPVSILGKIVDVDDEVKEKQQLEEKSRTDLLTGLLNKHTFEKEVRDYVDAHPTESACFVFIDMDNFKKINDTFGHSVGDQVIKETAKKVQLLFANFDLVGRFGGDEFCVFVKGIPRNTLIDRLRFAVKKMEQEYTYEGGSVKISASIGAAYCKKNRAGYKELMDVADGAAYQAKDNGRNCYIIKDVE